jgi:carbon storage regulator
MLVLTRKTNQSIVIGDDVEISVLAVAGDKVRIGIEAPRSVPVYRKEVWLEIQRDGPRSTPTERERRHVDEEVQKLKSGD